MKHWLFKHYWWIALLIAGCAIGGVLLFIGCQSVSLIGSIIAGALGTCYFAQQQKLAETKLFKELFTEFNLRYEVLNDGLNQIVESGVSPTGDERNKVIDYFNLCGEEYLFWKEGYIHAEVWRSWCSGMLGYFDREPFRALWNDERATNSYYGLSLEEIRKGIG